MKFKDIMYYLVNEVIIHWDWFLVITSVFILLIALRDKNNDLIAAYFCGVSVGIICMMGAIKNA